MMTCGCFDDFVGQGNGPADDDAGTTSDGSSTSPTTSGGPTGASVDGSTSNDSQPSSDTSEGPEGSSGDAPVESCWGSDAEWNTDELDLADLGAPSPDALVLSPDGLTLWFAAGPPEARVPYESSRPDRNANFGAGTPVAGWPAEPSIAQPRLAHEVGKAIARVEGELWAALLDGGTWGGLESIKFEGLNGALSDPSLSSDGETLLFVHQELYEKTQGLIWVPHMAQWPELSAPPSNATPLLLPTFQRAHAQLCPAISPDSRHLLLGSSYPETWSSGIQGDLDIFSSDATGIGWTEPERIPALSSTDLNACPTSMTSDGCSVIIRYFDTPFTGATFVLGHRAPR